MFLGVAKTQCTGCMKAAWALFQQILCNFGVVNLRQCFKTVRPFFALAPKSGFGAAISAATVYVKASVFKSLLCVRVFCASFAVQSNTGK